MLIGSLDENAGGVAECVKSVSSALTETTSCSVEIFSIHRQGGHKLGALPNSVSTYIAPGSGPAAFGYAPHLSDALIDADLDILHVHGLWMYMSIAALRWSARTNRRYVVSPHGMLDPWAVRNSRLKKVVAGALYENRHLQRAACLHALCEAEERAIRDYGLTGPVCVIPNGVDPPPEGRIGSASWCQRTNGSARILLYLGRLHPKKGVHDLVEAWGDVAADGPSSSGWQLAIAGSGPDDYVSDLQARIEARSLEDVVHLVGPQYGHEKEETFAAASAFILPSLSEGQPVAVLEAWARGLPTLLTDECNLPEGFASGAALRIETGRQGIAAGLRRLFATDDATLSAMADAARTLAGDHFAWHRSAAQMEALYRWVLGEGPAPRRLTSQPRAASSPGA